VVEYNTSTNPTFEGAVRDTSGRGNDGMFYGGALYDATEKVFDGFTTTNYIRTNLTVFRGNVPHSHSVWFKLTSINGNWNTAINLGQNNTSNQSAVTWDTSTNKLWLNTYSGGVYVALTPDTGKWYHVVATHDGTGSPSNSTMKLYVDGVKQTTVDTGNGSGGSINIDGDYLSIGAGITSSGVVQNVFNGDISTYKLYDTALTAEEAKTLYDMGRCDEGGHIVNFSKTRVGIGLGDGEAPRGALDVRGDVAGPFHTFLTGDITTTSSSPTSSAHSPLVSYTFDVPKEYNSYGNVNLEVFGQVKWSGECPDPWNTNLSLRLYYGSGLTSYIGSAQVSGGSNSKGCGMIAVSHHADNNSTLDSAIASSKFLIPNCPVSPGSQLKLEILHSQGAGSGTVYTNRTTNAITTDYNYERGTTNFFMALKVV
jgi:hypothetical protein